MHIYYLPTSTTLKNNVFILIDNDLQQQPPWLWYYVRTYQNSYFICSTKITQYLHRMEFGLPALRILIITQKYYHHKLIYYCNVPIVVRYFISLLHECANVFTSLIVGIFFVTIFFTRTTFSNKKIINGFRETVR